MILTRGIGGGVGEEVVEPSKGLFGGVVGVVCVGWPGVVVGFAEGVEVVVDDGGVVGGNAFVVVVVVVAHAVCIVVALRLLCVDKYLI